MWKRLASETRVVPTRLVEAPASSPNVSASPLDEADASSPNVEASRFLNNRKYFIFCTANWHFMGFKYKIHDQDEFHFVTFTAVNWIDVFIRDSYREIFIDSVKHCQEKKGLLVGAWVIMTSHIHMIIGRSGSNNLENIIRDLKSFTSRHIRLEIEKNNYESRKEWMMPMFRDAGFNNSNNKDFQFWIQGSHPIQLSTGEMMNQRLHYIHNNPVEAGFVCEPQHWKYSSAHDYCGGTQGLIDLVMLA
jgi:putative transposase